MAKRLKPIEIEELESVHLERIRYYFLDNIDDIMEGLHSRLQIKSDWYKQFISTKSNMASDLEIGAERIFHYVFSRGMKHPNSSPIGADIMYETFDSFIHIDIKTVSESNWGDYKGKIAVQSNQTSYPLSKYKLSPNLPTYYSKTFKKGENEYYKPTLTYFIYVLHKHASEEIYSMLIICMPNGELYNIYRDKILHAGKTKNSVRYAFKEEPRFILLSKQKNVFRVEFLIKSRNYTQENLIGIPEKKYKIPVWVEI
ncbi:hypothetical protein F1847_00160 [Thermodesulfobacterium sp. TA1]|uniref:hypothetical protein n=1 Tax=Thermodesulfobacterium sp. TA1 TaxID=2234087 RepID=UPI001232D8E6|nr:hypothetical protein [Thermodesulfobacterium sp. TA1]QER41224.1 hypothetical protein F1847_00160 [Thermodesulfobacterium sp. TA1]